VFPSAAAALMPRACAHVTKIRKEGSRRRERVKYRDGDLRWERHAKHFEDRQKDRGRWQTTTPGTWKRLGEGGFPTTTRTNLEAAAEGELVDHPAARRVHGLEHAKRAALVGYRLLQLGHQPLEAALGLGRLLLLLVPEQTKNKTAKRARCQRFEHMQRTRDLGVEVHLKNTSACVSCQNEREGVRASVCAHGTYSLSALPRCSRSSLRFRARCARRSSRPQTT